MIRVLIAEDSPVVQKTLVRLLEDEPEIEIVGIASNGVEAIEKCRQLSPDLVTMDVFMPEMDGLEATRRIMKDCPTRIVIVSSMARSSEIVTTFEAMRAGAVDVIEKPHGVLAGNYAAVRDSLVHHLKEMIAARPAARRSLLPPGSTRSDSIPPSLIPPAVSVRLSRLPQEHRTSVVCFGGSTGAPTIIAEVLSRLPASFDVPIVIAQHIARGFGCGFGSWLNQLLPFEVGIAKEGDELRPGTVWICPDDKHITFASRRRISLELPGEIMEFTPSIDRFMLSAAERFGKEAVGVIFSGMGSDGAEGLLAMREVGAVTLSQDEKSSVVYGMPKVAKDIGASIETLPPKAISKFLSTLKGS